MSTKKGTFAKFKNNTISRTIAANIKGGMREIVERCTECTGDGENCTRHSSGFYWCKPNQW